MVTVLPDAVYLVLRAGLGGCARDGQHLWHRTRAVMVVSMRLATASGGLPQRASLLRIARP